MHWDYAALLFYYNTYIHSFIVYYAEAAWVSKKNTQDKTYKITDIQRSRHAIYSTSKSYTLHCLFATLFFISFLNVKLASLPLSVLTHTVFLQRAHHTRMRCYRVNGRKIFQWRGSFFTQRHYSVTPETVSLTASILFLGTSHLGWPVAAHGADWMPRQAVSAWPGLAWLAAHLQWRHRLRM